MKINSATVSSNLIPVAVLGLTIWVMVYGFAVVRGEVQEPVNLFAWKIVRVSIICAIALGGGYYQSMVVDGLKGIETFFVQSLHGTNVTTVGAAIDGAFDSLSPLQDDFYQKMVYSIGFVGFPGMGWLFGWLALIVAQVIIVVASLIPLLIAKVTLSILLAIGPAFILLALWQSTQRFTETWLTAVLTSVFTIVVIAAVMAFIPKVFLGFVVQVKSGLSAANETSHFERGVFVLIISFVMAWVAWNAASFAAQLAGGVSLGNPISSVVQTIMNKAAFSGGKAGRGGGLKKS